MAYVLIPGGEGIFKSYFVEIKMGLEENGTAQTSISVIIHKQFIEWQEPVEFFQLTTELYST